MAAYDIPGFHPFGRPLPADFGVDVDGAGVLVPERPVDIRPMLSTIRLEISEASGKEP
jgi:hypothetical protein